ncbi:myb-like protein AA [Musca vetustissima]|uniref:myb-like protein AA n=1 Tax=Musca vetustissima TaxID=27455 RepID=UPI002AB6BB0C|nr:myb-like protein AA [Musca vetustissima]
MDSIDESCEETSNDTTMISELLKSAEVMPQTQVLGAATTTSSSSSIGVNVTGAGTGGVLMKNYKTPSEKQIQPPTFHINPNNNVQIGPPPPPLTAIGHNNPTTTNIIMLNHQGYSNIASMEDSNKLQQQQQLRHVHIPYILNGELYQIQTQDGENVTVKCCHCPPDRVYRGSVRSTGNFHMHIKRRHPDLLEKLHDMKVNALLERRDRLMRNRKITSRSNRNNRIHSPNMVTTSIPPTTSLQQNKEEANQMMKIHETTALQQSLNTATDLGMLQTHKLKIKTVFQRHQMQQREAAGMHNWNNVDYVVLPIGGGEGGQLSTTASNDHPSPEGPINYSLKTTESSMPSHSSSQMSQQQQQQQLSSSNITPTTTTTNDINNNISSGQQLEQEQQQIATDYGSNNNNNSNNNEYLYENLHRNLSTTITHTSSVSPSVLSSFSSLNNNNNNNASNINQQYNMETISSSTYQPYINPSIHQSQQQHTLSIIKPEDLLIAPEQQAIDLTLNNDSGIFSNSSINISQNSNTTATTTHDKRAGSHHLHNSPSGNHTTGGGTTTTVADSIAQKWQELLMHVETSLRDIQHEMNIRNQIESNRMFLDIAKFKFLNPGFQFNW